MPWTFYNSSGQQLKSGETAISNLDIDGATDIGADIVDADLFIIDDGAGGTNRKTAASRISTYIEGAFTAGAKVDLGSNLLVGNGGSTGIAISANGEVTMAAQPSVFALNSAYDNTVTGNGATATADLNTERYDQNGDFASDTFTAPVTGRYLVAGCITLGERTTAHTQSDFDISFSNSIVRFAHVPNNNGNVRYGCSGTAIIDMDAADTLTLTVRSTGESSDVQRMLGHPDTNDTFISVQLIA